MVVLVLVDDVNELTFCNIGFKSIYYISYQSGNSLSSLGVVVDDAVVDVVVCVVVLLVVMGVVVDDAVVAIYVVVFNMLDEFVVLVVNESRMCLFFVLLGVSKVREIPTFVFPGHPNCI